MPMKAPILLFAYKRPSHTSRTLEALQKNDGARDHSVYIYLDGPKCELDIPLVEETRRICRKAQGFRELHVIEREENLGLADSIILGVSEVLSKNEAVIVLEDDIVTSPAFLKFMNNGLEHYFENRRVASIHGYCYPVNGLPESFFLRGADCWGWATWRRAWSKFRPDAGALLAQIRRERLSYRFDLDGAYPFTTMLSNQVAGHISSWAIRWHASAFLENMFTLYPGKSLVANIGLDGSGTHCAEDRAFEVEINRDLPRIFPGKIEEDEAAKEKIRQYFIGNMSVRQRISYLLRRGVNGVGI